MDSTRDDRAERRFDIAFVAPLALAEKQIQQSYRPTIQIHKWFARRPGTLFRALLLAEFGDERPLRESFYDGHQLDGETVLDPFMGGGTPILEANRLGMNVIGCDINPMASWIVRQELAQVDVEALRACAEGVLDRVEHKLHHLYTTRCLECGEDAAVKYFLWVKTLACKECGEDVDLFPGYRIASNARHPNHVLVCPACRDLFEVAHMPARGARVRCTRCASEWSHTPVALRSRYTCGSCGHAGRYPRDLAPQGPPRHSLIALEVHCVACKPTHEGRFFKAPDEADRGLYDEARQMLRRRPRLKAWIPDEAIPAGDETTRLHRWGYTHYAQLFNDRQQLSLGTLAAEIGRVREREFRHALATIFSDSLRYQNMLARYDTYALKCQDIFSVHGFPVGLIQCENNVCGIPRVGSGAFRHFLEKTIRAKRYGAEPYETIRDGKKKRRVPIVGERIAAEFVDGPPRTDASRQAWIHCGDATALDVPAGSIDAVLTDPPYFANVQYAELMDFCYVWLRRLIGTDVPIFDRATTRSDDELTGNRTAGRDLEHFCGGLSAAYVAAARALKPGGLFAFTYHHNEVEAYLPVAVALLDAGLVATASLACPAEMTASLHIAGTGSSIVDTILCSRKSSAGRARPRSRRPSVTDALRAQSQALRSGGLQATAGDLRCMALGLLTVEAVRALAPGWEPAAPVRERLDRARTRFAFLIERIGGLDTVVARTIGELSALRIDMRAPTVEPT